MQNSLMVNSLNVIQSNLTKPQLRLNSLKQEQGAPNWLTTLPMKEEKYNLTTGHYWDRFQTVNVVWNSPTWSVKEERIFLSLRRNHHIKKHACIIADRSLQRRSSRASRAIANSKILQQQIAKENEVGLHICVKGFWKVGQIVYFGLKGF